MPEKVKSSITEEGRARFNKLFGDNSEYSQYFKTSYIARNDANDARIVPRFYKEVKWYSLFEKVTGENTDVTRLSLHDWISLPHKTTQNRYYLNIRRWVFSYFANILNILQNPDRDDYLTCTS